MSAIRRSSCVFQEFPSLPSFSSHIPGRSGDDLNVRDDPSPAPSRRGGKRDSLRGGEMRSSTILLTCVVLASCGWSAVGANPPDFERRVAAQKAIEEVLWRPRIWPADNPGPKPALEQVLPESVLRARVQDSLLQSKALERVWSRPIRNEDLQTDLARMSASSRAPEILREMLAALGNDAGLVAEYLV